MIYGQTGEFLYGMETISIQTHLSGKLVQILNRLLGAAGVCRLLISNDRLDHTRVGKKLN